MWLGIVVTVEPYYAMGTAFKIAIITIIFSSFRLVIWTESAYRKIKSILIQRYSFVALQSFSVHLKEIKSELDLPAILELR